MEEKKTVTSFSQGRSKTDSKKKNSKSKNNDNTQDAKDIDFNSTSNTQNKRNAIIFTGRALQEITRDMTM